MERSVDGFVDCDLILQHPEVPTLSRLSAHDTRAFADPAGTPRASQSTSGLSRILVVFGRVPLFYYLLHIYVIHVIAIVAASAFHQPIWHGTVIETTPNAL